MANISKLNVHGTEYNLKDTEARQSKINLPVVNDQINYGTSGQILRTNGNGTTVWTDAADPTEVANAVTAWLAEKNTNGDEPIVVDASLNMSGAAADAKVTGDNITDLKSAIDPVIVSNIFTTKGFTIGKTLNEDGSDKNTTTGGYTAILPVEGGKVYKLAFTFSNPTKWGVRILGYINGSYHAQIGEVIDTDTSGNFSTNIEIPSNVDGIKISFYKYTTINGDISLAKYVGNDGDVTAIDTVARNRINTLENTVESVTETIIGSKTAVDSVARTAVQNLSSAVESVTETISGSETAVDSAARTAVQNLSSVVNADNLILEKSNYLSETLRKITSEPLDALVEQLGRLSAIDDNTISRSIVIPNDGAVEMTNCVVRLGLHKGTAEGDTIYDEIWASNFRDDFSGLRFYGPNGNELKYEIVSHGNYDFVQDEALASYSNCSLFALSDGALVRTNTSNATIEKSTNNGQSWTAVTDFKGYLFFIDSNDNLYVGGRFGTEESHAYRSKIYRIAKTENGYTAPSSADDYIIDLSEYQGQIQPTACGETTGGTLIFGGYQEGTYSSDTEKYTPGATIFRSTDGGATFTAVYHTDEKQHVHNIFVDKRDQLNNVIYAGLDDSMHREGPACLKSMDDGVTWVEVDVPYRNRDYFPVYVGGTKSAGFMLGGGEANILGGETLYRTGNEDNPDDYRLVLENHSGLRTVFGNDNQLFAGVTAGHSNMLHQIYMSTDTGFNWKPVYIDKYKRLSYSGAGGGVRVATKYFTPAGATENQYILTGFGMTSALRCYVGGNRHYAAVLLYLPRIPVGGITITMTGNKAISTSCLLNEEPYTPKFTVNMNEGWGEYTNGVTFRGVQMHGVKYWEKITEIPALIKDGRNLESYGVVLAEDGYISLPKIPVPTSKNLAISFWLKMPDDPAVMLDGTTKWVLFNSSRYELSIVGRKFKIGYGSVNSRTYADINLPIEAVYSAGMWRLFFVTVGGDDTPMLKTFYYDRKAYEKLSNTFTNVSLQSLTGVTIGKSSYNDGEKCWPYGLSDFRIYWRSAGYSHADVIRIMNGYGFATSDFT